MSGAHNAAGLQRILVTGGAGFIGSHLVRHLLEHHHCRITVIDNMTRPSSQCLPVDDRLKMVHADICDRTAISRASRGVDLVFHLAAVSTVMGAESDIEATVKSNISGTSEVLRAAAAAGVRRLVFASSREVYGEVSRLPASERTALDPKNVYGASKAAAEALCRDLRPETVVLRMANVYGLGDRDRVIPTFLRQAAGGEDIVLYGGNQILDFVWIDDVVDAMVAAAFRPEISGPINLGSGLGITVGELAELVVQLSGTGSVIRREPSRSPEVSQFVADITRACSLLGMIRPTVRLAQLPRLIRAQSAEVTTMP